MLNRRRTTVTDEIKKQIHEQYQSGVPIKTIVKNTGVVRQTIYRHLDLQNKHVTKKGTGQTHKKLTWGLTPDNTWDTVRAKIHKMGYGAFTDEMQDVFTLQMFEDAHVEGNPGRINATLEEMCPKKQDQESVMFYTYQREVPPVVLMRIGDKLVLVDGMHRIVAAYITNSPIVATIVRPTDHNPSFVIRGGFDVANALKKITDNIEDVERSHNSRVRYGSDV